MRCTLCGKTWTIPRPSTLGDMRIGMDLAESVIKHLCEGTSVRATARLTTTDPQTVIDLMLLIGNRCKSFMEKDLQGIAVEDVQVDEAWQFVFCKERTAKLKGYGQETGDSYVFTAIERSTKLLLAWHFGKRDQWHTDTFCEKLERATSGYFLLSTDGYKPYLSAVVRFLGNRVEHGTVVKIFSNPARSEQRTYSPPKIIGMKKEAAWNTPDMRRVSTSHVDAAELEFPHVHASNDAAFKWLLEEVGEPRSHARPLHLPLQLRAGAWHNQDDAGRGERRGKRCWTVRDMIERTATT